MTHEQLMKMLPQFASKYGVVEAKTLRYLHYLIWLVNMLDLSNGTVMLEGRHDEANCSSKVFEQGQFLN